MVKKQPKPKKLYVLLDLSRTHRVGVMGTETGIGVSWVETDLAMSWHDGQVGALPAFTNKAKARKARKFPEQEIVVCELYSGKEDV